ncbi:MAG: fused MFS/spermidine synthase [Phycisphaerae bacterium]
MVGKMVLPYLGGTPAVWNTCMVFFQALLLAGYAYVHSSVKRFGVRKQAAFHLLLMLAPLLVLPITINTESVPTDMDNPIGWLLLRLLLGVGLPFFVISTSAPLLQMWFAETSHRSARDPYFLYAASNFGSMIALLGYPIFVEPAFALDDQRVLWKYGYILLVALAFGCAAVMWRSRPADPLIPGTTATDNEGSIGEGKSLSTWRQFRWVLMAFIPSSLMLGVTTHVTTEIAPVPLLWVVPLALYLFTFVLVFAKVQILPHRIVLAILPIFIVPTALMTVRNEAALGLIPLPLHLVTFFLVAMACHGEMAADRPSTTHLTKFYLLMSVGGVLGGIANSVVAPLLFNTLLEYPLVMVIAGFALVSKPKPPTFNTKVVRDIGLSLLFGALIAAMLVYMQKSNTGNARGFDPIALLIPAAMCWACTNRPIRYAFMFATMVAVSLICYELKTDHALHMSRNFYGTKRVVVDEGKSAHTFIHGATIHGIQALADASAHVPRTYFHPDGPVGDVFEVINRREGAKAIGVIGLGVGSMASPIYAKASGSFTFYEIDPAIARIARNPELFTFLEDCPARVEVVLGDGRLTLANAPDNHFDAIFLDAFSSDAVPTHLLTREAIQLYESKLRDEGILVFNMSNRYLNLAPLISTLASDTGFWCAKRDDDVSPETTAKTGRLSSRFMVLTRDKNCIRQIKRKGNWEEMDLVDERLIWTDKYTNVFRLLHWGN